MVQTIIFLTILFFAVIFVSVVLARFSLKNFQEAPKDRLKRPYGLYLLDIKDIHSALLERLYQAFKEDEVIFSLERLSKGGEVAYILYAPKNITSLLEDLNLVELEDYLSEEPVSNEKIVTPDSSIGFELIRGQGTGDRVQGNLFEGIELNSKQQFFWQLVLSPDPKQENNFQLNLRGLVVDADIHERVKLGKGVKEQMIEKTGFSEKADAKSIKSVFSAFHNRLITPKEIKAQVVGIDEVLGLLGLSNQ